METKEQVRERLEGDLLSEQQEIVRIRTQLVELGYLTNKSLDLLSRYILGTIRMDKCRECLAELERPAPTIEQVRDFLDANPICLDDPL